MYQLQDWMYKTATFFVFCSLGMAFLLEGYAQKLCGFDKFASPGTYSPMIEAAISSGISHTQRSSTDTLWIPLVVHIIHEGGEENISNEQIHSQIRILNEDFGKIAGSMGEGEGVDTHIRFRLASRNPDGKCTDGIVRISSYLAQHQSNQRRLLTQLSAWDPERYLNIYVVGSIGNGVLGYAAFPGGPAEENGVVVVHNAFGKGGSTRAPYHLGRTLTHEVGHWLGLFHTFQGGCGIDPCTDGDRVCDTPPSASPSRECLNRNSCNNDQPDLNDQVDNYMDYTSDACKSRFTQGQTDRMRGVIDVFRSTIVSDTNLEFTGLNRPIQPMANCPTIADFVSLNTDLCVGHWLRYVNRSLNSADSFSWYFEGGIPETSSEESPFIIYISPGIYDVTLVASKNGLKDSLTLENYIQVREPEVGTPLYLEEGFESASLFTQGLSRYNPDNGIRWEIDSVAAASGRYSVKINNLINTNYGTTDELILPLLNLTSAHPDSSIFLAFQWAYAQSDPIFSDDLLVQISTDCGLKFDKLFAGRAESLATAPAQSSPFIPDSTQWKSIQIDLSAYRGADAAEIKFVNVTDGGNNLYLDNIYVGDGRRSIVGLNTLDERVNLKVFPNPASEQMYIQFSLAYAAYMDIELYDVLGQIVRKIPGKKYASGRHRLELATISLTRGIYWVKISTGSLTLAKKILIH